MASGESRSVARADQHNEIPKQVTRGKVNPVCCEDAPELSVKDFAPIIDKRIKGSRNKPHANGKYAGDEREPGQACWFGFVGW
jgi:hypothetical protein